MGTEIESKPAKAYDLGLTGRPLNERPGIMLPTPANIDAVAANAAAQRQRETEARNCNPNDLGRSWGVTHEMALWCQRLEGMVLEHARTIAELRSEIAQLRSSALPRHMVDVERR
jgi:hypothetical protein